MNSNATYRRHLDAIRRGAVEKTNVIGLRKVFNAQWRRERGYSISRTAPAVTPAEANTLQAALVQYRPRVAGALHDSGAKLLRSPRYAKRWTSHERHVIAGLHEFRLIDFIDHGGNGGGAFVPVYEARSIDGAAFRFYNVAWQSGGDGPQVLGLR